MTIGISTAFVSAFSDDVKHQYQSMGSGLLQRVRTKTGVTGSTYKFHKMGKGLASARIPQSDVVPMNVTNSSATATLSDWNAPEYSDIFDLEKISYNERQELVKVVSGAITRRQEELVLLALDAGASSTQVAENFGGTATGLTVTKIRKAKRLMDAAGVPMQDRTFLHDAIGLEQLLGSTLVTSSDYNSVKALVHGEVDTYLGFKFICFEDRTEGGIVTTSNVTKNFAFHKDAVGLAEGMAARTEINYIPEKTSWLINGMFSAGAVGIDNTGIYEVLTNNTYVL
jgi:hypothetical protein